MRIPTTAWIPLAIVLTGCASPEFPCEWEEEEPLLLDLDDRSHRRHLSDDALLAEDIAIRHSDGACGPLSGNRRAGCGQVRAACMATLVSAIETRHGVTALQVEEALLLRRTGLDALVFLSFAVLYALAVLRVTRRMYRSVLADKAWRTVVAVGVVSPVVSLSGVFAGWFWSVTIEVIRVGNQHLSNRSDRIPWGNHLEELFVAGLVLFWVVAALSHRFGAHDADIDADVRLLTPARKNR